MWFARFRWDDWQACRQGLERAGLRLYRSEDGNEGCAYWPARPDEPAPVLPPGVSPVRLQSRGEVPGASFGAPAPWHYIVATDVLDDHEADFNAWYDQEHLPGLAAVPGTVKASRYLAADGPGPRYHACYDLAVRGAFDSAAWRAVRATAWSARVRPAFRNTLRVMYKRVS